LLRQEVPLQQSASVAQLEPLPWHGEKTHTCCAPTVAQASPLQQLALVQPVEPGN
jgi:hypothetical protein